jgi:hypothetical protein
MGHYASEIDPTWGMNQAESNAYYLALRQAERERAALQTAIAHEHLPGLIAEFTARYDMPLLVWDFGEALRRKDKRFYSTPAIAEALYQLAREGKVRRVQTGWVPVS